MIDINCKEYWNQRFSNDWDKMKGSEQTSFFYSLLIEYLPNWLKEELGKESTIVCDWGAGNGVGTSMLAKTFPKSKFIGVDISEDGISHAKNNHESENCHFDVKDVFSESIGEYDLIISSNTLEHFRDPEFVIDKLAAENAKHLVFLLPYMEEKKDKEHFVTFDEKNLPVIIRNKYVLTHCKIIDAERYVDSRWCGYQVLVSFSRIDLLDDIGVKYNVCVNDIFDASMVKEKYEKNTERKLISIENKLLEIETSTNNKISSISELINTIERKKISTRLKLMLNKSIFYYRKYGVLSLSRKVVFKLLSTVTRNNKLINKIKELMYKRKLETILSTTTYKHIIVFPPVVDWELELFQRPHHIASRLASDDVLYFFCTPNNSDEVQGFKKLKKNLYLSNCFELVSKVDNCILHCYSTDNFSYGGSFEFYKDAIDNGHKVIYEYIDEIHENISGVTIPQDVLNKHEMFLKDERVICIASADKLIDDVELVRDSNYKLVTNGVDVEHFRKNLNKDIFPVELDAIVRSAKDNDRKIIGYFGAFASWFDYKLITEVAKTGKYEIALIGVDYDGTIANSSFDEYENIHYLGPVNYSELPNYATWFDILTIPFLINDITVSTSPIKLFEYMAMEKPIVTTAMPECMKYKGVYIGTTHDDFIEKLDIASEMIGNCEYLNGLLQLANENSWDKKAEDILVMVD
ncbi:methyltransferase domain-containing protein [Photobacterium chitinilyticum]|uniref:methyltransferase domain-containing protein n=1 Tax=Photobacterium chitinilyticum TaxID=2485123 RepID=UPI003D0D2C3B